MSTKFPSPPTTSTLQPNIEHTSTDRTPFRITTYLDCDFENNIHNNIEMLPKKSTGAGKAAAQTPGKKATTAGKAATQIPPKKTTEAEETDIKRSPTPEMPTGYAKVSLVVPYVETTLDYIVKEDKETKTRLAWYSMTKHHDKQTSFRFTAYNPEDEKEVVKKLLYHLRELNGEELLDFMGYISDPSRDTEKTFPTMATNPSSGPGTTTAHTATRYARIPSPNPCWLLVCSLRNRKNTYLTKNSKGHVTAGLCHWCQVQDFQALLALRARVLRVRAFQAQVAEYVRHQQFPQVRERRGRCEGLGGTQAEDKRFYEIVKSAIGVSAQRFCVVLYGS
jgi:DNA-directed RNA polymerase subunit L